jgi:DNA-binding Lrp family transcriptional regulator
MSKVWDMDLPAKDKLVLLALADCANDDGLAWPSIATLARKCGCDARTVQRNLRRLEAAGHISREEVIGKGCKYRFTPRQIATPDKSPPRQNDGATKTTRTPGKLPPKPSRTVNDLPNGKSKTRVQCAKPDEVSEAIWRDFTRQRKKPVTETALKGLKREADKAGWTLEAAIEEATMRGWEGFKADWVKGASNDNRNRNSTGGSTRNAAQEALARLQHGR